ncbi:PTS sugar transporter subunit IIA, partial [Oenococcus oeni]
IPHTDAKYVNETQIAFMSLSKPVEFKQMGDNAKVEAKFIFMLALDNPHKQPQMLQRLMALFQNEKAMKKLETIKDEKDFIEIMKKEGIEEGQ